MDCFFSCGCSRHDWYQTESNVVVTVMAKNVSKDGVCVRFTDKEVQTHLNATLKWKESVLSLYLCRDGLALGFFLKGPH